MQWSGNTVSRQWPVVTCPLRGLHPSPSLFPLFYLFVCFVLEYLWSPVYIHDHARRSPFSFLICYVSFSLFLEYCWWPVVNYPLLACTILVEICSVLFCFLSAYFKAWFINSFYFWLLICLCFRFFYCLCIRLLVLSLFERMVEAVITLVIASLLQGLHWFAAA